MIKPVSVPLLDLKAQYSILRDEIRPAIDRAGVFELQKAAELTDERQSMRSCRK